MLIDTHAHVNFSAYREDADAVIRRSLDENVWMVNVGSDYKSSKRALDYANKYQRGVYAAVGLHPIHTWEYKDEKEVIPAEEFTYEMYEKLASFEKVVAIGEIGLDYYRLDTNGNAEAQKEKQKEIFVKQLEVAARSELPVIIHCRQAHDDMVKILSDFKKEYRDIIMKDRPWGVLHCFSGDENLAWQYFGLGLIVSFTGLITFSRQWDELIRKLPMDKFMIETDCPFMTPEPHRGTRNEPLYVNFVAQRIAEIKGLTVDRIAEATTGTAREFFGV